jgi:hypothetical protein
VEGTQRTLGRPVFGRCFHLVLCRAKAVDGQTLQQRNASPLVGEISVNSGRTIEPTSLEMTPRVTACLYDNPWAARPYQGELDRFCHAVVNENKLEFHDGESLSTILGLPEEWPGE